LPANSRLPVPRTPQIKQTVCHNKGNHNRHGSNRAFAPAKSVDAATAIPSNTKSTSHFSIGPIRRSRSCARHQENQGHLVRFLLDWNGFTREGVMTNSELRSDIHSIEPIPDSDRDSTGPQQMWIWAGANIAPVNWALGALGIILKLGLWETIAVIVLGNIVGCAIFAAFTVMGHKTGVNQMVLSRSAFGRRGAYLPSLLMFLMTLCWIGVNTYFPVKISMAILGQFGIPESLLTTFIVMTIVMVIQVVIGIYGFYAIRTFEKYTVPVTVVIMALMSVLAWSQPGVVNWNLTSSLPPGPHFAMLSLLTTAIGVGWGISWVTWASDYSRFVPRSVSSSSVFWYSYVGMFVPSVWLAILGATIASVTVDTDPAKMVSAVFGGVASLLVLLMVLHGPIATNILNVYSAALAALSMGIRLSRTALALIVGIIGYLVTIYFVFAPSFAKAFDNWMISLLLWMSPWAGVILADFFIKRKSKIDVAELYASPETSAYGDINWGAIIAFLVGLAAGWSLEDGLVPALQGPLSGLMNGADLSWLAGIVVAGGLYLAIGGRTVPASVVAATAAK
jgi:NCS1 nucleoside transporter family